MSRPPTETPLAGGCRLLWPLPASSCWLVRGCGLKTGRLRRWLLRRWLLRRWLVQRRGPERKPLGLDSTAAQSRPPLWLWADWAAPNRRATCLRCPTRLGQKDQLTCWEKAKPDPIPCVTPCGSLTGRYRCRHRVWISLTPAGSPLLAVRSRCRSDCCQPRDELPPPCSSFSPSQSWRETAATAAPIS
jgi:hypothetical protein